jgi:hypothetical protein
VSDNWYKGGKRAIDDSMKEEVVNRLLAVWKENSSMRFMQLLGNVFREDAYYLEDYDMIRKVEEQYDRT